MKHAIQLLTETKNKLEYIYKTCIIDGSVDENCDNAILFTEQIKSYKKAIEFLSSELITKDQLIKTLKDYHDSLMPKIDGSYSNLIEKKVNEFIKYYEL